MDHLFLRSFQNILQLSPGEYWSLEAIGQTVCARAIAANLLA